MSGRVLVVDDHPELREVLGQGLSDRGYETLAVATAEEALLGLDRREFDVLLADFQLEGMNGIELCRHSREIQPELPVIVITGYDSYDTAVAALRAGAYDFLAKPLDIEVVGAAVERAIERYRLSREVKRLRAEVDAAHEFGEVVGRSPAMKKVFSVLARASESDATVLLVGESGTGKELVARALHRRGPRQGGPFVGVNCAAVPEALLESELFGHVRGAFTGAGVDRQGLLFQADGGTLFLDEIADMPPGMQVKLLRALEERVARPVGSDRERPFDARLIAATNRDIDSEVEDGRLRPDLYFRINVIRIDLPPLRARGADILHLSQHLLRQLGRAMDKGVRGISPEAAGHMLAYDWPGNVRELRNCIERAVALARYDQITVDDLPDKLRRSPADRVFAIGDSITELVPLDEIQRRYVVKALEATRGNRTLAARILGLDRKTLRRKLERWGVRKTAPGASSDE